MKTRHITPLGWAALTLAWVGAAAQADTVNVFDITGGGQTFVGSVQTIDTAQTAADHYDVFSASGHPTGVPLGNTNASVYIHQNTNTGDLAFAFIVSQDSGGSGNGSFQAVVTDSTADPVLSVSEDSGEFSENPADTFGDPTFSYTNNADGFVVDGIAGPAWQITIDQTFSNVTQYFVASGNGSHLPINPNNQYLLTPIPEPTAALILTTPALILLARRTRQRKSGA